MTQAGKRISCSDSEVRADTSGSGWADSGSGLHSAQGLDTRNTVFAQSRIDVPATVENHTRSGPTGRAVRVYSRCGGVLIRAWILVRKTMPPRCPVTTPAKSRRGCRQLSVSGAATPCTGLLRWWSSWCWYISRSRRASSGTVEKSRDDDRSAPRDSAGLQRSPCGSWCAQGCRRPGPIRGTAPVGEAGSYRFGGVIVPGTTVQQRSRKTPRCCATAGPVPPS